MTYASPWQVSVFRTSFQATSNRVTVSPYLLVPPHEGRPWHQHVPHARWCFSTTFSK